MYDEKLKLDCMDFILTTIQRLLDIYIHTYIYSIYPRELPYSTQVDYLLSQYASKFMKFILENQLVIMKSKAKV